MKPIMLSFVKSTRMIRQFQRFYVSFVFLEFLEDDFSKTLLKLSTEFTPPTYNINVSFRFDCYFISLTFN
jgi:hypothetical protein